QRGCGVRAIGFGCRARVEPEPVGLLREGDAAERVVVPELQSEAHVHDPTPVSTALFPPAYVERRELYRAFMEAHVLPNEQLLDREDDAAQELVRTLREQARTA